MRYQLLSNQPGRIGTLLCGLALNFGLAGCGADGSCNAASLTSCLSCSDSTADCNRDASDGCEVNTLTDPNHCGRCDKACPGVGQQRGLCVHGVCSTCPSGRLDCNGLGADGCETKVSSDPENCGQCGMVCPDVRNGVPGCINASCTIASCQQGFEDCDGNPLNGCETDARSDPHNCLTCGLACTSTQHALVACIDSRCQTTNDCESGYANCDNDLSNGCETARLTDRNHCGTCTNVCPSQQSCVNGQCMP